MFKIILLLFPIVVNASYYKKCDLVDSIEKCEKVTMNDTFKQLTLSDIKVDECYSKVENNKQIFFKVTKINKTAITAHAEVILDNSWDNRIISDVFFWEGDYFNYKMKEISCEMTPHLSNENYLKQMCSLSITSRGISHCQQPTIRKNTFERKL